MAAFAGASPRGDTGRRGTSILAAGGWSNCSLRHASAEDWTALRRRTLGPAFWRALWEFGPEVRGTLDGLGRSRQWSSERALQMMDHRGKRVCPTATSANPPAT